MPVPQQSQITQPYGNPYNPLATTRAPIPESLHGPEGLAALAPGTTASMPDPLPRSCVEKGWRYECVAPGGGIAFADGF
jgi:hypothetical protein